MKAGHLSNKEFTEQCRAKSMQCKRFNTCHVHEGRKNVKKLRNLLQKRIDPNHKGWKQGIKWNIEKGGFLETLFNFQHLREELLKTKRAGNKFNKSREKLPEYVEHINLLLEAKSQATNQIKKRVKNRNFEKKKKGKKKEPPPKP